MLLLSVDTLGSNNLYEENKHIFCRGKNQLNGITGRTYLCANNALAILC